MALDPFSPVAPARVKLLLIPVGQIKQSVFENSVRRLQQEHVVRLGDVSPDSRPHRTMFSPLAFSEGRILYDLSTTNSPASHLELAPLELHRQPLIVVGVAHHVENKRAPTDQNAEAVGGAQAKEELDVLISHLDGLRTDFSDALVHRVLVFDLIAAEKSLPESIVAVPPIDKSRTTTIKTVMCDLTSDLLAEMTTYAKSLQGLDLLDTPKGITEPMSLGGLASALPSHMNGSSRPSSASHRSRSFSPAGDAANSGHRMSMPVLPSDLTSRSSTPDNRAERPYNGNRRPSGTFGERNGGVSVPSLPREDDRARSRPASQDRFSTSGFGPGSLGERERNRVKGRVSVLIGAMYLLAGRWPDAIKELVQSSMATRANSDYVWQAKALDYLLVCLLMCAWAGMDFRIPEILRPGLERSSTGSSKPSTHIQSYSMSEVIVPASVDLERRSATLHSLASLLPELVNTILNLYSRAWTFTDDKLSPLSFSTSSIRFTNLLANVAISHGTLNDDSLNKFVGNMDITHTKASAIDAISMQSKIDIVTLLFRAYPDSSLDSWQSMPDRTHILAAMAAVLSQLGFHRKKAVIMREILIALLPALVQARKDGAAEMGVHPAASLASMNAIPESSAKGQSNLTHDDSEQDLRKFLSLVCEAYGIIPQHQDFDSKQEQVGSSSDLPAYPRAINSSAAAAIRQASTSAYGAHDLKVDILRSCINICEALPDLPAALEFSAKLLKTAGSGIAPGPDSSNGSPSLPIEEQVRLANNISRTLGAAQHLGLKHPEADYWDEFLVRGVEVMDVSAARSLTSHASSELEIVETIEAKKEKNPFIYNPFLKEKASSAAGPILVANEEIIFRVMLQNLYDFDVHVESIRLEYDGVDLECPSQTTMIGPYRTQTMLLTGTPRSPGSLTILGCKAKVKGCCERSFFIFAEPWALAVDVKGQNLALGGKPAKNRSTSSIPHSDRAKPPETSQGPKAAPLELTVIHGQPSVVMKSISLPQSAVMLLEGEKRTFTIKLRNISKSPVDLLLLSFADATTTQLQAAVASKELSAAELYELELTSSRKQSFRWLRPNRNRDFRIQAEGEVTLDIEVLGRAGLSYSTIQVDYGYLGVPKSEIKDQFYTRQLTIPLTVCVNASINLVHNDLVPLSEDTYRQKVLQQQDLSKNGDAKTLSNDASDFLPRIGLIPSDTAIAMLYLDFRNSWANTLVLTLTVSPPPASTNTEFQTHSIALTLQPGTSSRIPVPVPRVYLPSSIAHKSIPSLNPANRRQFIVSATKNTPKAEMASRETFWFREELLKCLSAQWKEESTGREGEVDLRALKLNERMVSAYKLDDVEISTSITKYEPCSEEEKEGSQEVRQIGTQKFFVPTSTFLSLHTTLQNRSSQAIRPLLRLQPALSHQPPNVALDIGKKLLVNGVLQRALPVLDPGQTLTAETGFCVVSTGTFEWGASVEELKVAGKSVPREGKDTTGRKRAQTGELDLLQDDTRRLWHARKVCVLIARDTDGMDDQHDI